MPADHRETYGRQSPPLAPPFPKPADGIGLATPVGVLQDRHGRVWVADAGNNRLLVFDRELNTVLAQIGRFGSEPGAFDLPFRLAHHPTKERVFVTDLGNARVQELAYEDTADESGIAVSVEQLFSTTDDAFHPNGVAVHAEADDLRVFVTDEFYHEDATDTRSRVVVFDGDGTQQNSFRTVRGDDDPIGLYWPQGIDTDPDGNLLIANTGYGQQAREFGRPAYYANVVRCDKSGTAVPFPATGSAVLDDEFAIPRAVSYLPAEERIVVPDIGGGYLYAYSLDGDRRGEVPSVIAPDIESQRFGAPMAVTGYDPGPEADQTGAIRGRVLVTEALDHAVSAYRLRFVAERKRQLATVDGHRNRPGQFDYASGTAIQHSTERLWVGDGGNGRAQRTERAFSTPLAPEALNENRFPATLETWDCPNGETYLFAADYNADADEFDDERQIHCYRLRDGDDPEHVMGFGGWGYFGDDVRLPRGMAVEPIDERRVRLHIADSLNGRIAMWVVTPCTGEATHDGTDGSFGHDAGEFWLPSDVVVGPNAKYVADRSNNRIQYTAGEDWQTVGKAGYGDDSGRFLLPTSLALADGYLFVADLVNRAIKVFETEPDGGIPETPIDSFGTFGGQKTGGDLWFPAMLSATAHDDGVTVILPDSVLNVVYRFEWTPPSR